MSAVGVVQQAPFTSEFATYVGGPNCDRAYGIEVGRDDSVHIAGRAGPGFLTTQGTIQRGFGGDLAAGANALYGRQDGFIARPAPDGSQLMWATYFGSDHSAIVRDVDVDFKGDCYVVSPGNLRASHPHVRACAYDTTHNGGQDVVVAKISANGARVTWGTFLGGSGDDGGGPWSVSTSRQARWSWWAIRHRRTYRRHGVTTEVMVAAARWRTPREHLPRWQRW